MPRIRKEFLGKLISHINRKGWWHVPPMDPGAYRKRGRFFASSFPEAELYGRPLDTPQRVTIANPLVGDESTVCRALFGKVISFAQAEDRSFLEKRLALDARMKRTASARGYDSIVIMHPRTFGLFRNTGKIPRSVELNVLNP